MNLEELAETLDRSGDFRVLRRLAAPDVQPRPLRAGERLAVVLDTETTGLDARVDQVTELAMLSFVYDENGVAGDVVGTFSALREPTVPIPETVQRLTGITPDLVKGHRIDMAAVDAFIEPASLIIAHNAAFDRPMAESLSPLFAAKAWACTATQLDWQGLGFEGRKLVYLLYQFGMFHDGHRALDDVFATFEILRHLLPGRSSSTLPLLLATARRPTIRIWAQATSAAVPALRARGYRWQPSTETRDRYWWRDLPANTERQERAFLETLGSVVTIQDVRRITAFERFRLPS